MPWWDDTLDLGAQDYGDEDDLGISQFLAPPGARQNQAAPAWQGQTYSPAPSPGMPDQTPDLAGGDPFAPQNNAGAYESPFGELDAYQTLDRDTEFKKTRYSELNRSASDWESRLSDFKTNKLKPFYEGLSDLMFGDPSTEEEYIQAIDESFAGMQETAMADPSILGSSSGQEYAQQRMADFAPWQGDNGLKAQMLKLKYEASSRRMAADEAGSSYRQVDDLLMSIPLAERMMMDDDLGLLKKRRIAKERAPRSERATGAALDEMHFQDPEYYNKVLMNPYNIDPRTEIEGDSSGSQADRMIQERRMKAAARGDMETLMNQRKALHKDRTLKDRGVLFSYINGTVEYTNPLGINRNDTDLLDLAKMRDAGMKSFKGQPLEVAIQGLGGEERLEVAKTLKSVYEARDNWQDAQIAYAAKAGSSGAEPLRQRMLAAEETKNKTIEMAAKRGLDNELFEQAETVGWLEGLGSAIKKGLLMSKQSNYTVDFLTNTLDLDDQKRLIETVEDMEDIPESTAMQRYNESIAKKPPADTLEAISTLFGHKQVMHEMFWESMASFLPTTAKMVGFTTAAGAIAGGLLGRKAGSKVGAKWGAKLGAKLSWAMSSFALEMSGGTLQGMQELGINVKDPKVFTAAWNNEVIREKIKTSAIKHGLPIAFMDGVNVMFAGRIAASMTQSGRKLLTGGKLLDPTHWAKGWEKAQGAVPKFTKFQRLRAAGAEFALGDMATGMFGEYWGQSWEKEPGEPYDHSAIAAEGLVGAGPGAVGGMLNYYKSRPEVVSFEDAPFDYSNVTRDERGETGTINRAGWETRYRTHDTSNSMTVQLNELGEHDINSEAGMMAQDLTARLYDLKSSVMKRVRIVVDPRVPGAGGQKVAGAIQMDEAGNPVIYMNPEAYKKNPLGVFLHESGHLARIFIFPNVEGEHSSAKLLKLYNELSGEEKMDAFRRYHAVGLREAQPGEVERAYHDLGANYRAEEWFAFQWAQVLAGGTVDSKIKGNLTSFYDSIIKDFAAQYMLDPSGQPMSESKGKGSDYLIKQKILQEMGFDMDGVPTKVDYSVTEGIRSPALDQPVNDAEGINNLIDEIRAIWPSPKDNERMAAALEAMVGEDLGLLSRMVEINRMSGKAASDRDREPSDPSFIGPRESLEPVDPRMLPPAAKFAEERKAAEEKETKRKEDARGDASDAEFKSMEEVEKLIADNALPAAEQPKGLYPIDPEGGDSTITIGEDTYAWDKESKSYKLKEKAAEETTEEETTEEEATEEEDGPPTPTSDTSKLKPGDPHPDFDGVELLKRNPKTGNAIWTPSEGFKWVDNDDRNNLNTVAKEKATEEEATEEEEPAAEEEEPAAEEEEPAAEEEKKGESKVIHPGYFSGDTAERHVVALEGETTEDVMTLIATGDLKKDDARVFKDRKDAEDYAEVFGYAGSEYNPPEKEGAVEKAVSGLRKVSDDEGSKSLGKIYHGARASDAKSYINAKGDLVLRKSSNFDGRQVGVSFTSDLASAQEYATRQTDQGKSLAAIRQYDGSVFEIDADAVEGLEGEAMGELFADGRDVIIPKGKFTRLDTKELSPSTDDLLIELADAEDLPLKFSYEFLDKRLDELEAVTNPSETQQIALENTNSALVTLEDDLEDEIDAEPKYPRSLDDTYKHVGSLTYKDDESARKRAQDGTPSQKELSEKEDRLNRLLEDAGRRMGSSRKKGMGVGRNYQGSMASTDPRKTTAVIAPPTIYTPHEIDDKEAGKRQTDELDSLKKKFIAAQKKKDDKALARVKSEVKTHKEKILRDFKDPSTVDTYELDRLLPHATYKKKIKGKYEVQFVLPGGKQIKTETFKSEAAAEKAVGTWQKDQLKGMREQTQRLDKLTTELQDDALTVKAIRKALLAVAKGQNPKAKKITQAMKDRVSVLEVATELLEMEEMRKLSAYGPKAKGEALLGTEAVTGHRFQKEQDTLADESDKFTSRHELDLEKLSQRLEDIETELGLMDTLEGKSKKAKSITGSKQRKALEAARDQTQDIISILYPEAHALSWKDVPHPFLVRASTKAGTKRTGKRKSKKGIVGDWLPVTLGEMAASGAFIEKLMLRKNKRYAEYIAKGYWPDRLANKKRFVEESMTNPQEQLAQLIESYDPNAKADEKKGTKAVKPTDLIDDKKGDTTTAGDVRRALDLARAAMLPPRPAGMGPMGQIHKAKGKVPRAQIPAPDRTGGFTSETGTTLAGLAIDKILRSGLVKGPSVGKDVPPTQQAVLDHAGPMADKLTDTVSDANKLFNLLGDTQLGILEQDIQALQYEIDNTQQDDLADIPSRGAGFSFDPKKKKPSTPKKLEGLHKRMKLLRSKRLKALVDYAEYGHPEADPNRGVAAVFPMAQGGHSSHPDVATGLVNRDGDAIPGNPSILWDRALGEWNTFRQRIIAINQILDYWFSDMQRDANSQLGYIYGLENRDSVDNKEMFLPLGGLNRLMTGTGLDMRSDPGLEVVEIYDPHIRAKSRQRVSSGYWEKQDNGDWKDVMYQSVVRKADTEAVALVERYMNLPRLGNDLINKDLNTGTDLDKGQAKAHYDSLNKRSKKISDYLDTLEKNPKTKKIIQDVKAETTEITRLNRAAEAMIKKMAKASEPREPGEDRVIKSLYNDIPPSTRKRAMDGLRKANRDLQSIVTRVIDEAFGTDKTFAEARDSFAEDIAKARARVKKAKDLLEKSGYEYVPQGERPTETIKSQGSTFNRDEIYKGFDVVKAVDKLPVDTTGPKPSSGRIARQDEFSNIAAMYDESGKLLPEYAPVEGDSVTAFGEDFAYASEKWHLVDGEANTTPTQRKSATEAWANKQDSILMSSRRYASMPSIADVVSYLLNGNKPEKLQLIASSRVKNGLRQNPPGAPGMGDLPRVWYSFLEDAYKRLGLKQPRVTPPDSEYNWHQHSSKFLGLEPGTIFEKGRIPHPDNMRAELRPLVQAVLDAGAYSLYAYTDFEKEGPVDKGRIEPRENIGVEKDKEGSEFEIDDENYDNEDPAGAQEHSEDYTGPDSGNWMGHPDQATADATADPSDVYQATQQIVSEFPRIINEFGRLARGNEGAVMDKLTLPHIVEAFPPTHGIDGGPATNGKNSRNPNLWSVLGLPPPPIRGEALAGMAGKIQVLPRELRSVAGKLKKGLSVTDAAWDAAVENLHPEEQGPYLYKGTPGTKGFHQWMDDLRKHKNFKVLKSLMDAKYKTTMYQGSSYILTDRLPDNFAKLGLFARITGRGGRDKDYLRQKFGALSDWKMAIVNQAMPLRNLTDKIFDDHGFRTLVNLDPKFQDFKDLLNTHAKGHAYFGKGYHEIDRAERNWITPIRDAMRKYGISQERFGRYLLARAAPTRNHHLYMQHLDRLEKFNAAIKEYGKDSRLGKSSTAQVIKYKKEIEAHGVPYSGISNAAAVDVVTLMEDDANFMSFLNTGVLDKFYEMNKDALAAKETSELIKGPESKIGSERDRMLRAASYVDWNAGTIDATMKSETAVRFSSKIKTKDAYSYAPMQGFEGENSEHFDNDAAYRALGKKSGSSGTGWDQSRKHMLGKGAFGRTEDTYAPNPEAVFATATEQFYSDKILSQKNEVSKSFGMLFDFLKSLAYPDEAIPSIKANPEFKALQNALGPESRDALIKEFNDTFQKDFTEKTKESRYALERKVPEDENGKKLERLAVYRSTLDHKLADDPFTFVYRNKGEPVFIQFKKTEAGARMASSMKNLNYEALPKVLGGVNVITRWMAQTYTSMNPAFIIPNFVRDLGTAFIHLNEDEKRVLVKSALNFGNISGAMKGIFRAERAKAHGENVLGDLPITMDTAQSLLAEGDWAKKYQFAMAAGARVGMFRHDTVAEHIRKTQDEIANKSRPLAMAEKKAKEMTGSFFGLIEHANTSVENSIRMSTFWAAIEQGWTVPQATDAARNVTVDFNQKGNLTQVFGSFYVFFGATMTSADRLFRTFLRRSPAERTMLATSLIGASMVVNLFNRLLDPEDEDDDEQDYDSISSYKRDTNLILPMPAKFPGNDSRDTGFFSIPVPLGYNTFWTMGQVMGDLFADKVLGAGNTTSLLETATRPMQRIADTFNPVGSAATLAGFVTPTAAKPISDIFISNKDYMGRKIKYERLPFEAKKPAHMLDPKSTPEHWTKMSELINEFLGGTDVSKGSVSNLTGDNALMYSEDHDIKFDISGNQMKHLVYGYTGGVGKMFDQFGGALLRGYQGKTPFDDYTDVPIVNRFIRGTTYGANTRNAYRSIRDAVETAKKLREDSLKKDPIVRQKIMADTRVLLSMQDGVKHMDASRNKIRRLIRKIESTKGMTPAQKTQRVDELEEKELTMMIKLVKKARKLGFVA